MRAKEISTLLANKAEVVAQYLLPNGKRVGNEWCVGSINGEPGKSLKVCLSGEKIGIWKDFAADSNMGGDLLDLWCQIRSVTISEAILEVKLWLGISTPKISPSRRSDFAKPQSKDHMAVNMTSPVGKYLIQERQLTPETVQAFSLYEENHTILFPYLRNGELIQLKRLGLKRTHHKKSIRVEPNCEPCLFGWPTIPDNARTITIVEGELDAMSLYQYGIYALSVPFGGGGGNKHQWLSYEFERLACFDEIYLCFDQDEAGQIAVTELVDRLGRHRCRVVTLPYKDANECLQKDVTTAEIHQCFSKATSLDPIELKSASLFAKQVITTFCADQTSAHGIKPPWEKAKGKIAFRPAELSVWTGINGHGKSQMLGQIMLSSMQQGARVCIASLELKPTRLLARLTRQATALENPTNEYINAVHRWYEDKLWLFELVGTAKTERLLEVFLYARQRYAVDTFVIDSLMKCGISEDDYNAQKQFIEALCDFKNQYDCHIHIVVHPRKGIDEIKPPGKLDIKGSGAITDLADNSFVVWRNKKKGEALHVLKQKEDSKEFKNVSQQLDCMWICDKQRNGEWEGKIALWFNPNSFQYLNHHGQKPHRYVDYSVIHHHQHYQTKEKIA